MGGGGGEVFPTKAPLSRFGYETIYFPFVHGPKKPRASNSFLSLEENLNMPSLNWHLIPLSDNSPNKPPHTWPQGPNLGGTGTGFPEYDTGLEGETGHPHFYPLVPHS